MSQSISHACFPEVTIEEAIKAVAPQVKGVHPECAKVPCIQTHDFDQLVASINQYDLLRPVEIDAENRLVDGRSRVLACFRLNRQLRDADIVVTSRDPLAIAASNNSRRHLSDDQKAMEAVRLLEAERARAASRKAEGARKGRETKKTSVGTKSVPSVAKPQKRQPRATDTVARKTGVSRDKLNTAMTLKTVAPHLAKQVEHGELPLKVAAEQAGILKKKILNPKPSTVGTKAPKPLPASAVPTGAVELWKDELTTLVDLPRGLRRAWSPFATLFIHASNQSAGAVLGSSDQWHWYVGQEGKSGTELTRQSAEQKVIATLAPSKPKA